MKKLLLIALLAASGAAMAIPATWTGQMEYVTTVNGNMAYKCWYALGDGRVVAVIFRSSCPGRADIN